MSDQLLQRCPVKSLFPGSGDQDGARGHSVGREEEAPEAGAPRSHSCLAVGDSVLCHSEKAVRASLPAPCLHTGPLEIGPSLREFPEEDISKLLCFVFLLLLSLFESPSSACAQSHCWWFVFSYHGTNDHHGWAQGTLLQAEVQPRIQVSRSLTTSAWCFLERSPQGGD